MKGVPVFLKRCLAGIILAGFICLSQSFRVKGTISVYEEPGILKPKLSAYAIFQRAPAELAPAAGFELYELQSELFSDYAQKQRLIHLPENTKLTVQGNGLPQFPEGTILVKTFYYLDSKAVSKRRIVETRLLIFSGKQWIAGTYVWNAAQNDAELVTSGRKIELYLSSVSAATRKISYEVPNQRDCTACHGSGSGKQPIGPEIRNLNRKVFRNGKSQNQLVYWQQKGLLDSKQAIPVEKLADYNDTTATLEQRARAYLSINCAHCHHPAGSASIRTNLYLHASVSLEESGILSRRAKILRKMEQGRMPKIGTSLVHREGLELIRAYLQTLE